MAEEPKPISLYVELPGTTPRWWDDGAIAIWIRENVYRVMQEHVDVDITDRDEEGHRCRVTIAGIPDEKRRRIKDVLTYTSMEQITDALEIEVALPANAPLARSDGITAIWIKTKIAEACRELGIRIQDNVSVEILVKTGSWCCIRIENLPEEGVERIAEILAKRRIKNPIADNLENTADYE